MIKLIDCGIETLWHGNILRLPGKWPYEEYVDFMIFDSQNKERPYGLIVTSGYKAGLILALLPGECTQDGGGVSKSWIISNWNEWIYTECNVSEVYFHEGYEASPPSLYQGSHLKDQKEKP